MPSATVRINETTHRTLKGLAQQLGQPMQVILAQAIEEYRRNSLLRSANRAFSQLRQDPTAWAEEQQERADWDRTLADGQDE